MEPSARVGLRHARGGELEHPPEALLALLQLGRERLAPLPGAHLVGDLDREQHHRGDPAGLVLHRLVDDVEEALLEPAVVLAVELDPHLVPAPALAGADHPLDEVGDALRQMLRVGLAAGAAEQRAVAVERPEPRVREHVPLLGRGDDADDRRHLIEDRVQLGPRGLGAAARVHLLGELDADRDQPGHHPLAVAERLEVERVVALVELALAGAGELHRQLGDELALTGRVDLVHQLEQALPLGLGERGPDREPDEAALVHHPLVGGVRELVDVLRPREDGNRGRRLHQQGIEARALRLGDPRRPAPREDPADPGPEQRLVDRRADDVVSERERDLELRLGRLAIREEDHREAGALAPPRADRLRPRRPAARRSRPRTTRCRARAATRSRRREAEVPQPGEAPPSRLGLLGAVHRNEHFGRHPSADFIGRVLGSPRSPTNVSHARQPFAGQGGDRRATGAPRRRPPPTRQGAVITVSAVPIWSARWLRIPFQRLMSSTVTP